MAESSKGTGSRLSAVKLRQQRLAEQKKAQEEEKAKAEQKRLEAKALREKAQGPSRIKTRGTPIKDGVSGARRSSRNLSRRRSSKLSDKEIESIMAGISWDEKDAEFDVQKGCELLLTLDEDWETRMDYAKSITGILVDQDMDDKDWIPRWRMFRRPLGEQMADNRSEVIKRVSDYLIEIIKDRGKCMTPWGPYLLQQIFDNGVLAVKIEVMRQAAERLGETIVKKIPDDEERLMLNCILAAQDTGHANQRTQCALYLKLYFTKLDPIEEDEYTRDFLDNVTKAVKKACDDASPEGREMGYKALNEWKRINPQRAQTIIDTFKPVVMRRYKAVG